ncbi:hypothetical protein M5K25_020639 [Dendrobium thyrsiflorum]|uniref:RNase H type-1 domain-containing protein n=1 Tax=Dendrobium thyrsiflorum TaxID=117978 RepID=A0ABD0UAJ4_DENTH
MDLFRNDNIYVLTKSYIAVNSERETDVHENVLALQCGLETTGIVQACAEGVLAHVEANKLVEGLGPVGGVVAEMGLEGNSVVLEEGELDQGVLVVDMPIEHSSMQNENQFSVNEHYLSDVFTDTEDMDVQANYVAFESSFSKGRSRRGHIRMLFLPSFYGIYGWKGIILGLMSFKNYFFVMEDFGINLIVLNSQRMPRSIDFLKPLVNFFKLNVDNAFLNSVWGCGGLIRDSNGDFILVLRGLVLTFAINYGILYGLRLCLSLDMTNLVVEVSSNFYGNSFIWNNTNGNCSPNLFYMRRDIRNLLNILNYPFSEVHVKGNACANAIAKWGCGLDSMVDLPVSNLPHLMTGLIDLDKIGLPYVTYWGFRFIIAWFASLVAVSVGGGALGFWTVSWCPSALSLDEHKVNFLSAGFRALLSISEFEIPLRTL